MENKWFRFVVISSFLLGITLIIISLFLPPAGVIDPSVVQSVGMIFTFAAVFEALLSDKIIRLNFKFGELFIGDKNAQNKNDDVCDE